MNQCSSRNLVFTSCHEPHKLHLPSGQVLSECSRHGCRGLRIAHRRGVEIGAEDTENVRFGERLGCCVTPKITEERKLTENLGLTELSQFMHATVLILREQPYTSPPYDVETEAGIALVIQDLVTAVR